MGATDRRGTRTGFTTGACSAAAARAAVVGLLTGSVPTEVECLLPNGQQVRFAVAEGACAAGRARAVVVKDAGDDPDVTHLARLTAEVQLLADAVGVVQLAGGAGVGTVTQPGLGIAVGGPAINPVPRRNIEENVRLAAGPLLAEWGVVVTISVPGGEALARRTLNPRLGIVGGISILGTSGIVHPYSTAAFRASVVQGIEVAARQGQTSVVLTTGGRTEKFVMRELPQLAPACFVQMGDFLSYALETVVRTGIRQVVIGGMVGKLTKMAQGEGITHAHRSAVDTALVADIAATVGAPAAVCAAIRANATARYASECMAELGLEIPFYRELGRRVIHTLTNRYPGRFRLRLLICDFEGQRLAAVGDEDE